MVMIYKKRRFKPHDDRLISKMPHTIHVFKGEPIYDLINKNYWSGNNEVANWCDKMFGVLFTGWAYSLRYKNKIVFYFTSKDHALAFKLRWI